MIIGDNMRVYVVTCVLLICACALFDENVDALKWTFEKSNRLLDLSMHLTPNGLE